MASAYFTLPSFTRAKQNKEKLEKTNPQNPVLPENDQKWFEKFLKTSDKPATETSLVTTSKITDDGVEKPATNKDQKEAGQGADQVVIPDKHPESSTISTDETSTADKTDSKPKPKKTAELPSQEEAEAATRNFNFNPSKSNDTKSDNGKKPWTSYIPSIGSSSKKPTATDDPKTSEDDLQRSWTEFATSYLPSSWQPKFNPKDKDSRAEPVLKPDGTVDEAATAQKQEREIAVLLDNLNLSTINNRVFSFNDETRKIYERFSQCLRDTIDGVPTAYEDMEKLMREAGPTLEKQFKAMPPFVQTLVKSLPAKLSAAMAPELLAASSEKPGADLKAQMAAGEGSSNLKVPTGAAKSKKKRRVPNLKKLITQEGAAAGILKNVVNFLRVRFPFLASTTNVVMSLAVFILMFVFWYCHKRGKEVRLAREAEAASRAQSEAEDNTAESSADEDEGDDDDNERDDDNKEDTAKASSSGSKQATAEKSGQSKKPDPTSVPLPT